MKWVLSRSNPYFMFFIMHLFCLCFIIILQLYSQIQCRFTVTVLEVFRMHASGSNYIPKYTSKAQTCFEKADACGWNNRTQGPWECYCIPIIQRGILATAWGWVCTCIVYSMWGAESLLRRRLDGFTLSNVKRFWVIGFIVTFPAPFPFTAHK